MVLLVEEKLRKKLRRKAEELSAKEQAFCKPQGSESDFDAHFGMSPLLFGQEGLCSTIITNRLSLLPLSAAMQQGR